MSFFFNETKGDSKPKTPKKLRLQDIPVASLRQLGCSVCPRDKDAPNLRSPKMAPSGNEGAPIYLLGSAPSEDEDEDNNHWTDKAGNAVYQAFGKDFMRKHVRSNFIQQCRGDQTSIEVECCRSRIVADIERCRPEIVVTIGDAPLQWAVGTAVGGALNNRGVFFAAKIGNHTCYVYSILYPNFVHKRGYGKSEYERVLEHDVQHVKDSLGRMPAPRVYSAPYDGGIEIITGEEGGDYQRLEDRLNKLAQLANSAIDLETNGLRPYMLRDPRILTCALGSFEHTVAFPVDHPTEGWGSAKRKHEVKGLLRDYILESGRKAVHNLGFELEWFSFEFGTAIMRRTEWDDTMAMGHTLDERSGTKSLDMQIRRAFGFGIKALSNLDTARLLEYPLPQVLKYNGIDTKWTDLLRRHLQPIVFNENPEEYLRKVRLAPTLVATEAIGLVVDMGYAQAQADTLNADLRKIEAKLKRCPEVKKYEERFGTFSPTNPDNVLALYKTVCERDEVRVEDRGGAVRWATEKEALTKIPVADCPSAPLILEHRGSSKLLGTYVEPVISRKIVCQDGRMRGKYSSMVAVTGRLACEDPNVQNFPKRKHKQIRGMVRAPEWMLSADYGQIEFRVVGMASEDDNLVKYCWTGYDVHAYWAQRIVDKYGAVKDYIWNDFQDSIQGLLKKDPDEDKAILKTLRQEAKNGWVFPQLFGSSTRSCAANLHIPENIADDLGEEFWDEFKGVKRWQEKTVAKYERDLYVECLSGRKRRGAISRNELINLPIQGTAADIVTEGMCALSERADAEWDEELQPVLNVHDDLTFYLSDATLEHKTPIIAREMCKPRFSYINVPLIVEVSVGRDWYKQEEVMKFSSADLFDIPNPYR